MGGFPTFNSNSISPRRTGYNYNRPKFYQMNEKYRQQIARATSSLPKFNITKEGNTEIPKEYQERAKAKLDSMLMNGQEISQSEQQNLLDTLAKLEMIEDISETMKGMTEAFEKLKPDTTETLTPLKENKINEKLE